MIHLGFFIYYYILSYVRRGLCDPPFFFLRRALCAVQSSCTVLFRCARPTHALHASSLSMKECHNLDKTMLENFCFGCNKFDIRQCPGCMTFCERVKRELNVVLCWACTNRNKHPYRFCWYCLREWSGTDDNNNKCGYADCCSNPGQGRVMKLLEEAKEMKISYGDTVCIDTRACPSCGTLCSHSNTGCKFVTCKCRNEFCFVCLEHPCDGDNCKPAPRQNFLACK